MNKFGFFLKKKVLPDCQRPQEEIWILDLTRYNAPFTNGDFTVFYSITGSDPQKDQSDVLSQ